MQWPPSVGMSVSAISILSEVKDLHNIPEHLFAIVDEDTEVVGQSLLHEGESKPGTPPTNGGSEVK